jgi:hypothetical protein
MADRQERKKQTQQEIDAYWDAHMPTPSIMEQGYKMMKEQREAMRRFNQQKSGESGCFFILMIIIAIVMVAISKGWLK